MLSEVSQGKQAYQNVVENYGMDTTRSNADGDIA